jgi:hypothetical protein
MFQEKKAEVMYAFEARSAQELTVTVGETVVVLQEYEGWFSCRNASGAEGVCPSAYLKVEGTAGSC